MQSNTIMAINRAFRILKGKWHILLKMIDMPFQNILDIITTSLCPHNVYILESNEFDMNWTRSVEKELQREVNMALGRLHDT